VHNSQYWEVIRVTESSRSMRRVFWGYSVVQSIDYSGLIDRMLGFLTTNPSGDEVAQALALDYLGAYSATKLRISLLGNDDSLYFLGDYGWNPSRTHTMESSNVWRNRTDEILDVKIEDDFFGTNEALTAAAALLKIREVTSGTVSMVFHRPLFATQVAEVREILRQIVKPLALFFLIRPGFGFNAQGTHGSSAVIDIGAFSQRQLLVLKSITDSKTNNVIARELGFSVSTIRHETMRIFEILSVSDRREAAQKAVSLGIV